MLAIKMRKLSLISLSHINERPFYDPPYESPPEDIFALTIIKYLNTSIAFQKQVEVATICGKFRIDFIADCGSKKEVTVSGVLSMGCRSVYTVCINRNGLFGQ